MRLPSLLVALPALTLPLMTLSACGSDASSDDGAEGVSSGVGTGAEAGGTEGGSGGEDTGPAPIEPEPVRGLRITSVTANQGVAVTVGNGTSWVGPESRNSRLISNRDTLLRVFFEIDDGWVDRDIECRLQLKMPNGEIREYNQRIEDVYRDSNPRFLDSTCYWGLIAAEGETDPGVEYSISIWDVEEGGAPLTQHPSIVPDTGSNLIGFEAGTMNLKVRLVPVTYNGITPDVAGNRQAFEDDLFMQNPLQTIELDVRQPISSGNPSLGTMLSLMSQYHAQDGAPNNMYYFALIQTGAQSGTIGLAQLGALWGSALWLNSLTMTTGTFVHEIGHNQGLGHVACPEVDGMPPYENYPYGDGLIGRTGFGIRNFQLYGPDLNYAYMSYCGQGNGQWASDWDWNRNWSRIAQFSAQGLNTPKQPVLHGIIEPDGTENWWTVQDHLDEENFSGNHEVTIEKDGETYSSLMTQKVLSDGVSIWLTAPLPEDMEMEGASVSRRFLENTYDVTLPADKLLHDLPVTSRK